MLLSEQKTIICADCGKEKPISEYYCSMSGNGKVYASNICKECKKARVKYIYYTSEKNKRRKRRKAYNTDTDRTEAQPEFYEVRGKVVYAKLMFFDTRKVKWRNEFLPIISFPTEEQCYQFLAVARDLPTGELKRMCAKYLIKHGLRLD